MSKPLPLTSFAPLVIVYEVNLVVDAEVAEAYADWLGPHVEQVLALDGFLGAAWFEVEADETDPGPGPGQAPRVRWCVRYRLRDRAALERYLDQHAARLRADGLEKFGGRFEAARRVMARRAVIQARAG